MSSMNTELIPDKCFTAETLKSEGFSFGLRLTQASTQFRSLWSKVTEENKNKEAPDSQISFTPLYPNANSVHLQCCTYFWHCTLLTTDTPIWLTQIPPTSTLNLKNIVYRNANCLLRQ